MLIGSDNVGRENGCSQRIVTADKRIIAWGVGDSGVAIGGLGVRVGLGFGVSVDGDRVRGRNFMCGELAQVGNIAIAGNGHHQCAVAVVKGHQFLNRLLGLHHQIAAYNLTCGATILKVVAGCQAASRT